MTGTGAAPGRSRVLSVVAGAICLLTLLGWLLEMGPLVTVLPGLPPMMANTALAGLLVSAGIFLSAGRSSSGRWAIVCGIVVAVIAGLTGVEYLAGWNLGIDQLLAADHFSRPPATSGRMAFNVTLSYVLMGASMIFLGSSRTPSVWLPEACTLGAGFLAFAGFTGYALSVLSPGGMTWSAGMGLSTSIVLLLLSAALLGRSQGPIMRIVASGGPGGLIMRRSLPAVVVGALLVTWVGKEGTEFGLIDVHSGLATVVLGTLVLAIASALWTARSLDRATDELHDAQRELGESEERYRTVVERSLQATVVYQDGRVEYANQAAAAIVGRPLEHLRCLSADEVFQMVHPDDRVAAAERLRGRVAGAAVPERAQLRMVRPDGSVRWLETYGKAIDLSGKPAVIVTSLDVTERREAELRLADSEGRLREAQRIARLASWEQSLSSGEVTWSPEMYDILGVDPASVPPSIPAYLDRVHPQDRFIAEELFRMLSSDPRRYSMEYRVVQPAGDVRHILARAEVVRDVAGAGTKVVGTVQDVTEQKKLMDELRAGRAQRSALAQRILRIQEEERARIARELHDEMGQALTVLKLELQTAVKTADRERARRRLAGGVRIIDSLVEETRRISRMLRPALLDELGLSAALGSHARQQAKLAGLEATVQVASLERLSRDIEMACFRIAQEAITNAVRHARAQRLRVDLRQEGEWVCLTVCDNGVGIDVDTSDGSSLGLVGMTERAELVGGTCEVGPEPGGGTAVRARLPVHPKPPLGAT